MQVVDSLEKADVALLWLRPSVYQRPEHDYADIGLSPLTGIDVAKVKGIEATKPTVLVINFINPWVINEVEPGAAALLATFDVKAEALLDVVRGRFKPTGKLPLTVPADQAAVDRNAPDVPGLRGDVRLRVHKPREGQVRLRFRPELRQVIERAGPNPTGLRISLTASHCAPRRRRQGSRGLLVQRRRYRG